MAALDAATVIVVAVTEIEVIRTERISLIEIVVTEITAGVHTYPLMAPLYLRILCCSLPVLKNRLP
jgi:hypothetical protein